MAELGALYLMPTLTSHERIIMSQERNPTIPFGNFYHPPINLPEIMAEHGCAHATDLNVMHGLLSLVQFHKTERVGIYDLFIGDTCVVSHERLAERCFFNEKTIRRSIERLKEAGLIVQHKQGTCFWYHITIYDTAIDYLKRNPNHPMEATPSPVGSESKRQQIYEKVKTDAKSNIKSDSDFLPTNSDTVPKESDSKSRSQESLQEALQDPPDNTNGVSTSTAPNPPEAVGGILNQFDAELIDVIPVEEAEAEPTEDEEKASPKEKDVDSSLSQQSFASEPESTENDSDDAERSEATPEPVSENNAESDISSAAPPLDTVSNGHTEAYLDELNAGADIPSTDPPLEQFMEILKPPQGTIWTWKDTEPAIQLKEHLETLLEDNHVQTTPNRLFQAIVDEMNARIQSGRHPSSGAASFNYFLKHSQGIELVDYCLKLAKSASSNNIMIDKTKAYLDEFKSFERAEMPPEAKERMEAGVFDHISPRAQELIKKGIAHRNAGRNEAYYQAVQTAYRICPCDETQDCLDKAIEFTGEVT